MNCEQIQPNLLDYSRKLLSGPESEQIKAHLSQCAECAAVLQEEIASFHMLASIPEEKPQHDVWALVRSRTKPRLSLPFPILHGLFATNLRKAVTASITAAVLAFGFYNVTLVTHQHPVNPHPPVVAVYSDDPIAGHTAAVMASIDEM